MIDHGCANVVDHKTIPGVSLPKMLHVVTMLCCLGYASGPTPSQFVFPGSHPRFCFIQDKMLFGIVAADV